MKDSYKNADLSTNSCLTLSIDWLIYFRPNCVKATYRWDEEWNSEQPGRVDVSKSCSLEWGWERTDGVVCLPAGEESQCQSVN